MGNRTLAIIKPDAVQASHSGSIIQMIERAGFRIVALKKIRVSHALSQLFYAVHQERPFYNDLCAYIASGPIVPMILEKENAVASFRELIGATDPSKAAPGSVRAIFGSSIESNAVHGSDSDENAEKEGGFFFSQVERPVV